MKLYNSLTQKKESFNPRIPGEISMYVCGITPYDTTHLGHAFTYTFFDTLRRYLASKKYKVNYTQNVTDIDDDILRKAKEEHRDWRELGQFWTDHFLNDMKALNIAMPTHYVKATDSIPTIIEIVKKLVDEKIAYVKEGNVYFRVAKDPEYGKLSHYNPSQMLLLSKERGANPDDPNKENPLDFILWQRSQPDEPSWKSPWGRGRPGWHIECSAMVYQYLGEQIDIHGGGRDLIYPHHESEIAQSEYFTGKKPYVHYWMHTSMLMYQGEKMSKSLGNLIMVSDLLNNYSANAIRYLLLSHHYRAPWEFTYEQLDDAEKNVKLIEKVLQCHSREDGHPEQKISKEIPKQFGAALEDDMNTPEALKLVNHIAQKLLRHPQPLLQNNMKQMLEVLGFAL